MRPWTRGEMQAFGAVAKLFVIVGVLVVIGAASLKEYLIASVGLLIAAPGVALAIYLHRYSRRTGVSTAAFGRSRK